MVIANLLGIFLFLYLVWKRLKDDYSPEKIYNLAFLVLLSFFVSFFVTKNFLSEFWFWIGMIFITSSFLFAIRRQKIKLFESLEAIIIGLLPWLSFYFLTDSIKSSDLVSFLSFWVVLICIFLFFFISSHYRSFTFYKSGRVGFSGIVTLIFLFSTRIAFPFGILDKYFSGTVVFLLLLVLLHLNKNEK